MITLYHIFINTLFNFSISRFLIITLIIFIILFGYSMSYHHITQKHINFRSTILLFDTLCYLVFIFEVGLFSRTAGQPSNVYLLPFRFLFFGSSITRMRLIIFAALNLLYFIPYGFLLGFMTNKMKSAVSMYISLCISFITSFSLEFLQYISKRGHFETEDIILNTLGGFLGCIIYLVLYSIYKLFKSHLNTDA